jgi:formylglycine-generating enzyme required for sulfatase activity
MPVLVSMTFRRVLLVAALVLLTSGVSVAQLDSLQASTKDVQAVSEMVLIPSGHFWMGRARLYLGEEIGWLARDRTDDRPLHLVNLDAFYMDIHEVTNEAYVHFVVKNGGDAPYHWNGQSVSFVEIRHPVYNVTWREASAYCAWVGKRLPTEAEWERAARGGLEKLDYPWGNDFMRYPSDDVLSVDSAESEDVEPIRMAHTASGFGPTEVASFEPNDFGLYDVSGNVWEWVSDWYDTYYYSVSSQNNPTGPDDGHYKVIRGGGWGDPETRLATVYFRNFTGQDTRSPTIGFRCVKSALKN